MWLLSQWKRSDPNPESHALLTRYFLALPVSSSHTPVQMNPIDVDATRSERNGVFIDLDSMDVDLNSPEIEICVSPSSPPKPRNGVDGVSGNHYRAASSSTDRPYDPEAAQLEISRSPRSREEARPQISLDTMVRTLWNVFLHGVVPKDLADRDAVQGLIDATEEAYYFYIELVRPMMPDLTAEQLSFAQFFRVLFSGRLPAVVSLLDSPANGGLAQTNLDALDVVVNGRRDNRKTVAGVAILDSQKILLTTGHKNQCWSVPCCVVRENRLPIETAQQAGYEFFRRKLELDPSHFIAETLGGVVYLLYLHFGLSSKSEISRTKQTQFSVRSMQFISPLPAPFRVS